MNSIKQLINSPSWEKYNPTIVKENEDGVFVEMDDLDERYLFYFFVNPIDGKVQLNEISGFRKRWASVNELEDYLNN